MFTVTYQVEVRGNICFFSFYLPVEMELGFNIHGFLEAECVVVCFRWVFIHEKAYQITDTAIESSVMTKVKGFGIYNNKVMDVADYVTPTQGASVFCIITKLITTENQVQGYCPEFSCTQDSDCKKHTTKSGSVLTGRCVPINATNKILSVFLLSLFPHRTPMMEVENFTIFIKNSIRFPIFNYTKYIRNFLPTITDAYIKKCNFDKVNNTYCPIFRVGDVVRYAQQNFTKLADKVGVIGIKIGWMCDLDKSDDECNPSYSFNRLDAMSQKNAISPGYNFRFAKYYKMENGTDYRTLVKAYAIRFDVLVNGNLIVRKNSPCGIFCIYLLWLKKAGTQKAMFPYNVT
uniref:Purinergic receptor P2X, ligand-gated ion channel, 3b n=1 Tax=Sphaeramia orbicularis TaxID=375764 RepID=A0A672ZH27_9TELE